MIPPVLAHIKSLGYAVFDNPKYDYDLNIFGIRNSNGKTDTFDDYLGVFYMWDGTWRSHYWPATCDPGHYWLKNFEQLGVSGTAVLCPGQYRGAYELGEHKGKAALIQAGVVNVWRDPNRDNTVDRWGDIDEGYFGINIHRAGEKSTQVGKWSAGCQVLSRNDDMDELMDLCRKQVSFNGWKTFTYTLLDQWW